MPLCFLSACSARPDAYVLSQIEAPQDTNKIPIFVATTREYTRDHAGKNLYIFNNDRADTTNYARYLISVPPVHKTSEIEWSTNAPDPEKNFTVSDVEILDQKNFFDDLAKKTDDENTSQALGIFVHGFNTSYPEALFRVSQMAADSTMSGKAVLFAWPSQSRLGGYIADKESILYTRDYFVQFLTDIAKHKNITNVTIVAHSMGAWLVTESLRQLRLQGDDHVLDNLRIILAMPDIDEDVFKNQIATIGPLKFPMTLLVSSDDMALQISRRLSFAPRAGSIDVYDPEIQEIAVANGIRVIDVTQMPSDSLGHNRYVNINSIFPELIKDFKKQQSRDRHRTGVFIFDALTSTLTAPLDILSHSFNY